MTFHERKAERAKEYWRWHGVKMEFCYACNGTGYYDSFGSPPCGCCNGLGKYRGEPKMKTLKAFAEWKKEGYYVRKGEHAAGKDKYGISVFSEDQVELDYYE